MPFDQKYDPHLLAAQMWFAAHLEAAANASGLIAGPSARRSVMRLAEEIREAGTLSRLMRVRLGSLLRTLQLEGENEDDVGMLPLHPDDPRVLKICLLTDSLADLLADIGASPISQAA